MDITTILTGLIIIAALFLILAFVLSWLWNTTMPDVFSVNTINFWQALKMMLIVSILFGGTNAYVAAPTMVTTGASVTSE